MCMHIKFQALIWRCLPRLDACKQYHSINGGLIIFTCRHALHDVILADSAFIVIMWWACALAFFCMGRATKVYETIAVREQEIFCVVATKSTGVSNWDSISRICVLDRPASDRSWRRSRGDSVCTSSRRYLTPRESIQEASNLQSRWVDG